MVARSLVSVFSFSFPSVSQLVSFLLFFPFPSFLFSLFLFCSVLFFAFLLFSFLFFPAFLIYLPKFICAMILFVYFSISLSLSLSITININLSHSLSLSLSLGLPAYLSISFVAIHLSTCLPFYPLFVYSCQQYLFLSLLSL